jgi:hypothetical protein
VKYFTASFWKKVWYACGSYFRSQNNNIVYELAMRGIHIMPSEYPRILRYIEIVDGSRNVNVNLANFDYYELAKLVPEYSLDPIAILDYDKKDNLVPLVLRFTNPDNSATLLLAVIYDTNLSVNGICVYDPDNNLLAMKYFNGYKFFIRIGVSKIDESDTEKWFYDNYFFRDGIITLNSSPQRQGRIWFTRPFENL